MSAVPYSDTDFNIAGQYLESIEDHNSFYLYRNGQKSPTHPNDFEIHKPHPLKINFTLLPYPKETKLLLSSLATKISTKDTSDPFLADSVNGQILIAHVPNEGWKFTESAVGDKFNLYFDQAFSWRKTEDFKLKDVKGLWARVKAVAQGDLFFVVYSKGSANGWYGSKIVFNAKNKPTTMNKEYIYYWGQPPENVGTAELVELTFSSASSRVGTSTNPSEDEAVTAMNTNDVLQIAFSSNSSTNNVTVVKEIGILVELDSGVIKNDFVSMTA